MQYSTRNTIRSFLAVLLLWLPAAVMAAPVNDSFDHFSTGFPLTGGHRTVECDACHTSGTFAGTARECATCHSALMNTGAVVKSGFHIQSSNQCDACHSTLAWDDVRRVNHMSVLGQCRNCHLSDVPSVHVIIQPGDDCITCHRTSTWFAMHYNHSSAGTTCTNCHNGTNATGLSAGHISIAGLQCNACHSTRSWNFTHSGTAGQCKDCHENAAFAGVITQKADAGGTLHNSTSKSCDACHSTRAWTPASWDHTGAAYYPNHTFTRLSCSDCHGGGGDYTITWTYGTPDCLICHQSDFNKEHSGTSKHYCLSGCHEHSNALSRGKW